MRGNKGITLIALVITIIVLLIFAGISIASLTGENGILNKASETKEKTIKAQYEEELNLVIASMKTDAIYKAKEFNMNYIIEKLPVYLEAEGKTDYTWDTEQILDEPEGEYRGYSFYIDKNYIAHIGEEIKESERSFEIAIEEITTTSFKIVGNEEDLQSINATNYTYVIQTQLGNETKYENKTETSYTITGLEAETEYEVYMLAYDDNGNLIKKSTVQKVTTIYHPKINYSKEESLTLNVEVTYPKINGLNVRNEYSVDGENYKEYLDSVIVKEDCTFYARILNTQTNEIIAQNQEIIDNIIYQWETWNAVEKFRYEQSTKANDTFSPNVRYTQPITVYPQMVWTSTGATGYGTPISVNYNEREVAIGKYIINVYGGVTKIENTGNRVFPGGTYWNILGTTYNKTKSSDGFEKKDKLDDVTSGNKEDFPEDGIKGEIWYKLKEK